MSNQVQCQAPVALHNDDHRLSMVELKNLLMAQNGEAPPSGEAYDMRMFMIHPPFILFFLQHS